MTTEGSISSFPVNRTNTKTNSSTINRTIRIVTHISSISSTSRIVLYKVVMPRIIKFKITAAVLEIKVPFLHFK